MARGIRRFALAALVMVVVSPGAAAAVPTSVTPPGVPKVLRVTSTIEGVELVWSAADYVAGQPAPTSWTVRRSASEEDKAWTIANTSGLGSVTLRDDELPAGSQAEYTVTALADGVEGTPSPPVHGVHVADPGPFSPARRALTMTWDREDGSHKSAALLDTTGNPPIVTPVFTGVGLSDVAYGGRSYVSLPWPIEDGSYQVGTGPGLVEVIARAEAGCNQPSGIVTVRHAAPTRTGWWKSLTVDADLECDDGFHLRIEGRFATPEGVSAVSGPATRRSGPLPARPRRGRSRCATPGTAGLPRLGPDRAHGPVGPLRRRERGRVDLSGDGARAGSDVPDRRHTEPAPRMPGSGHATQDGSWWRRAEVRSGSERSSGRPRTN